MRKLVFPEPIMAIGKGALFLVQPKLHDIAPHKSAIARIPTVIVRDAERVRLKSVVRPVPDPPFAPSAALVQLLLALAADLGVRIFGL